MWILTSLPFTLIGTLVVEGIILLLFGFGIRKNIVAFVLVNVATQIMLYAYIICVSEDYRLFEIAIAIVEASLYARLLKEHSVLRRIAYAITANAASFAVGLVV